MLTTIGMLIAEVDDRSLVGPQTHLVSALAGLAKHYSSGMTSP